MDENKTIETQEQEVVEITVEKKGIVSKAKDFGRKGIALVKRNWKPFAIGVGTTLGAAVLSVVAGGKGGDAIDVTPVDGLPDVDITPDVAATEIPVIDVTIE